jgi:phosphate binding protein
VTAGATLIVVALAFMRVCEARRNETTAVEATELTAAGDLAPTFVEGPTPRIPKGKLALQPTITCRLLIDARGRVLQASVYRPRPELAAFETSALVAARASVFLPARRGKQAVAAWMHWPVAFGGSAHSSGEALGPARIRIKGSETIGGALGPALVRAFQQDHPGVEISIEAKGSGTAFVGLLDGSADLGAASRPVNDRELAQAALAGVVFHEFVLGYDGIAVIVHPDNPVRELTLDEVARLFTGQVGNWSEVGGRPGQVHAFGRPSSSGTRSFFRDKVLRRDDPKRGDDFSSVVREFERNEDIIEAVVRDSQSVAYVGLGFVQPRVRALSLARVVGEPSFLPDKRTVAEERYPIYRSLLLYFCGQPSGSTACFLRFALSQQGQTLVAEHGFIPSDTPLDAGRR